MLESRAAALRGAGRGSTWPGRNVGALALERVAQDPGRLVLIDGERQFDRASLLDAALRLGNGLQQRGMASGDAVAFQLPNWWEASVINLTAALFGWRLVPLLTIFREAELQFILGSTGVKAIFVPGVFRKHNFAALLQRLPAPPQLIFTVRANNGGLESFDMLMEADLGEPSPAPVDDVKMVLYTSGSTGMPKGVLHSHSSIDALITLTARFWNTGSDDRLYVPSPIGHIGGSIYAFEFPWITECIAVLTDSWQAEAAVADIARQGVTFMAGATPFLSDLVHAAAQMDATLPTLRRFLCGGASVPPELIRRALAQFSGAVISRGYGSTEVPLICPGVRSRAEAEAYVESDGECTADVLLLDEQDRPVADGATGEIVAKAPQMFLGYLEPADEVGCFTADGRFRMGDLGRCVDGHFLEITGRKKDIIIRKGENISPLEIENALMRHPAIRQVSVVGLPDVESGEVAMAFVVTQDGQNVTLPDIAAHLAALGLARQKCPERLHLMQELPLNAVGKVRKNDLRALALALPARPRQ